VGKQFFYYKLDVGRFDKHKECLKQYGVEGIPTIVAFNPDGSVRLSKDSYMNVADLKDFLGKAANAGPTAAGAAPAADNPWADNEKAKALIKDYLDRMKVVCTEEKSEGFPMLLFPVKMANATHHVKVVIDGKRGLVYIFLNRY
jgi:hypothetical protein